MIRAGFYALRAAPAFFKGDFARDARFFEWIHKVPVCVSLSSTRVKTVVKQWCDCCQKVCQSVRCVCENVFLRASCVVTGVFLKGSVARRERE
jgi:hypothetical protein